MSQLTLQQAYEKVWKYYVVDRNKPGVLDVNLATVGFVCSYMTPGGDKCSIGCLLSDPSVLKYSRYDIGTLMSGLGVDPEMEPILDEIRSIPLPALIDLQEYHDNATTNYRKLDGGLDSFLTSMEKSLEKFRELYCLDYPTY